MKATIFDSNGNPVADNDKIQCVLFEGNDVVESQIFKNDITVEIPNSHDEKFSRDNMFSCVNGENNISVFIHPNEKIFNVICRADMENGDYICTTMSFDGKDYDNFMELMKKIVNK